ncbi:hypothetical protein MYX78_07180 [Acidobacteria bacterium AH-259-G07]|nr:hypothetical protein [Acidobacteria bacterium AH-259-G07]
MHCDNCKKGRKLRPRKGLYHYTESGLPNIYLKNVEWYQCPHCEARRVLIPRMNQLHRCIAWRLVTKPSLLSGTEIVFLRKMLHLNQRQFAKHLGIGPVVLCRWEKEERIHRRTTDQLIRFVYLTSQDDEYTHEVHKEIWENLHKLFAKIERQVSTPRVEIDLKKCSAAYEVKRTFATAA